jgi:hypothetical protein
MLMATACGVVTFAVSTLNLTLFIPAMMPTTTGRARLRQYRLRKPQKHDGNARPLPRSLSHSFIL